MEGSGKIEMFFYLIVNCIFLKLWKDFKLNGRFVGVVFVDIDFYF